MTISIQVQPRHLAVATVVIVAAAVLAVWWASPARSQTDGPPAVDSYAFVARADNAVDALASSSVAGQLGAPVYLTFPGSLDGQAAEGLQAADPDVVVLAGGTVALSETVEQQVADLLPDADVRRMAGIGRTETAKLVNEMTRDLGVNRPVLSGATVAGDVGIEGALTVEGTNVAQAMRAVTSRVDALESDLAAANARVEQLESTFSGVERQSDTLVFSGMNVQVVNGQGATHLSNGLGNLIVGYNEDHTDGCFPSDDNCQFTGDGVTDDRAGSHNLIIGVDHSYTSYGGLLAGLDNEISGVFASVSGGEGNISSNTAAAVSGGQFNTASGRNASVSGGGSSAASGFVAAVSGGRSNSASGDGASVSGGTANSASESDTSVCGGLGNTASGLWASVSGGASNTASGFRSSVSGGEGNTARGSHASMSGGRNNIADGEWASVTGGSSNETASGTFDATVTGGSFNTSSGDRASVSGGLNNTASGDWASILGGENVTVSTDKGTAP